MRCYVPTLVHAEAATAVVRRTHETSPISARFHAEVLERHTAIVTITSFCYIALQSYELMYLLPSDDFEAFSCTPLSCQEKFRTARSLSNVFLRAARQS
jgi:hypothetical protein